MAAPASKNQDIIASLVLVAATIAALIVANSAMADIYKSVLAMEVGTNIGPFDLSDSVKNWIKTLLMAIFFLFVGLEIKAEFIEGALSDRRRAMLPFFAAVGGMAVPAIVFLTVVSGTDGLARGWAIPSATDIAFAVGVIGLLGSRVPPALKAFLLAVAVIDDLGAILIIAFFYTEALHLWAVGLAALSIGAMAVLNVRGYDRVGPYLFLGGLLWLFILQSGVNATLAGVITALFIPLKNQARTASPLHDLFTVLKTPVIFLIMPVFAFANAGVSMKGLGLEDLAMPLTAGIALGLAVGKPIGITLFTWAAIKTGLAQMPAGATWLQVVGVGFIAGIGFTMSLFIGALAFGDGALMDQVRLGVLSGSLVATLVGAAILVVAAREKVALKPAE
jgi:NhaA family Na+:H+ antiporter